MRYYDPNKKSGVSPNRLQLLSKVAFACSVLPFAFFGLWLLIALISRSIMPGISIINASMLGQIAGFMGIVGAALGIVAIASDIKYICRRSYLLSIAAIVMPVALIGVGIIIALIAIAIFNI